MNEKYIEQKFRDEVKKRGGCALKFTSPGMVGMPDRLILFPGGIMAFVELKAPGEKPRTIQVSRHRMLRGLGFRVYVVDRTEMIKEVLDEIQST